MFFLFFYYCQNIEPALETFNSNGTDHPSLIFRTYFFLLMQEIYHFISSLKFIRTKRPIK